MKPSYEDLERRIVFLEKEVNETQKLHIALQESEENYRQLFENSPSLIYRIDYLTGNILKANEVFCKNMGCTQDNLNKFKIDELLTPESKNLFYKRLDKILKGEEVPTTVEYEITDRTGKNNWLLLSMKNIYNSDGKLIAADVVGHDITAIKTVELKLKKAIGYTIHVLVSALESRDPYTVGHQSRVALLAKKIAEEMFLSQSKIDGLILAGNIHDIGKISIPSEILSKPNLTKLEFSLIKEHSRIGYDILKDVESPWPLADMVFHHHERINGSGYPQQLKEDNLLIEDKILSVADVVEAMTSHRPYREALGIDKALEEIQKFKGVSYDEKVVDICVKLFKEKEYQFNYQNIYTKIF